MTQVQTDMSVESLVLRAQRICDQNGARFTSIREKVFRLLAGTHSGVGAYELLQRFYAVSSF